LTHPETFFQIHGNGFGPSERRPIGEILFDLVRQVVGKNRGFGFLSEAKGNPGRVSPKRHFSLHMNRDLGGYPGSFGSGVFLTDHGLINQTQSFVLFEFYVIFEKITNPIKL